MVKITGGTNRSGVGVVMLSKELLFFLFVLAIVLIFRPNRVDAATFNVATGSSEVNDGDAVCQLDEAISNINQGTRTYVDCEETGTYGTNDTINLPSGTIYSGSGISDINQSVKIIGEGQGVSIIADRGLGFYGGGSGSGSGIDLVDVELRNFTMQGQGIYANIIDHLSINDVEIDGQNSAQYGLAEREVNNTQIKDSYIHDINSPSWVDEGGGIIFFSGSEASSISIERSTVSDVKGGAVLLFNTSGSGLDNPIPTSATFTNNTFTGINNSDPYSGSGSGLGDYEMTRLAAGIITVGNVNYSTINNTFNNFSNEAIDGYSPAAIMEIGIGDSHIRHTTQNDLYAVGEADGAVNYRRINSADIGSGFGGSGTPTFTTTSKGGNVSSDNSLSTWLNKPTDKHKQTSLASFLGALSDNGGKVPTLALLKNSPAVDAGVAVSGLTSDARGAIRPQGNAFDAGAYESAFTAESLAGTGQASRPAVFIASLLTLAAGALALVRKLKNRAKFIALR